MVSFARAIDGRSFVTDEGEEVQLAGILPIGAGEAVTPATQLAAQEGLTRILAERSLTVAPAGTPRDRYGRTVAFVFADRVSVQTSLVRAGDVRAAPDLASAACASALLAAETEARSARRGYWGQGVFRVRTPAALRSRVGSFEIVEGEVVTSTVTRGRAFINFGADYRSDFTVTVDPDDMRVFRQARFDIPALAGKRVRVRGWVEFYNGPEITITSPAAIEIVE
jgi:endonuclease YncB( thermonuclease family)